MVANKSTTALPETLIGEATGVLLVLSPSEDIAKRIESYLRNSGHPLRAAWINDVGDLQDVLQRNPPDLVLYDEATGNPSLDKIVGVCGLLRPDLPVIVIGTEHSVEDTVAALAAGAQDHVAYMDLRHLRHLELVIIREFVKHHHLRTLRLTQERLTDFESRHQQLTDSTGDAIALVQEGIVVKTNQAFTHLLGYDNPQQLTGQPLIDLVDADQQSKIKERLRAVLKGKHNGDPLELSLVSLTGKVTVQAQLILGNVDGERAIELLIRAEGGNGTPAATQSPVVGRNAFAIALGTPSDGKSTRAALLIRLDGFEALETRVGAIGAEAMATQAAQAIHSRLGPRDQSFAFSGDEIALVIHRPNPSEVEQFGEFLRRELAGQVFTAQEHEAQMTLTVAVFPLGENETVDKVTRELVEEVRKRSAKGGNQAFVLGATAKVHQDQRAEARKAAVVKKAIEDNRLKLAYQSIASLEGESRSHFDVLVRMMDEDGNEQHASEFLPAAARFNLMRTIDRWVITRALGVIAKRAAARETSVLFVKISEDTLRDSEAFVDWLKTQVKDHPLKSDEIIFEIQELILQNHIRKAKALTHELKAMGAGLAIEHYGVGASSAQMLDHIPAQFLKFHASFTQKFTEKDTQKRLRELVEIAKQRGMKTIVSHVEDANVMAKLWQMGVNFIQGYHVQEPEVVLLSSEVARRT